MKLRIINNYQQQLFPYAYNILGSVDDAMDAIQEVITKYLVNQNQEIENELGYLIKGVINQSINIKKRNQKKVDDKIWLPEPIAPESSDANINREEIISYSMLVMLEKLNPKERAVFILKEAFDYSHEEIAKALTFTIENSRKILSRAKKTLANTNLAIKPSAAPDPLFLQKYISLIKAGNVQELEKTLSHDMIVKTDGGNVSIVNELTIGLRDSMELMLYVFNTYQKDFTIIESIINHQPALLFYNNGQLVNCQIFELNSNGTKVKAIYSIVNPTKLF